MDIVNLLSKLTPQLMIITFSVLFPKTVYATSHCPRGLAVSQKRLDSKLGLGTPCLLWMLVTVVYVVILLITMRSGYVSLKRPRLKTLNATQQAVDIQELAHPEYLSIIFPMLLLMSLVLRNPAFGRLQWTVILLACTIGFARRKHDNPHEMFWWALYLLSGSILTHGIVYITLASMDRIDTATAWTLVPWICVMFVGINVGFLRFTKPTVGTINEQPQDQRDNKSPTIREDGDNESTAGVELPHQRQGKRLSKTETAHRMLNDLKLVRWTAVARR
jgi:hypothetical protein